MEGNNPLTSVPFDLERVPSPCYVVDEQLLSANLAILDNVQKRCGCKILLALKGFAMFSLFPLLRKVLHGTCASSLHEARLGREEFGGEVHTFAPAYSAGNIQEIAGLSDHLIFNSCSQWERFRPLVQSQKHLKFGLRVNPEHSETEVALYDPCAANSRLGITLDQFRPAALSGISGLHFHTLCEKDAAPLERTAAVFEKKFSPYIPGLDWLNFGGGHLITKADYDRDLLCQVIDYFRTKYSVEVYLEPGEAVALNTGFLVASVLDIIKNDMEIAVLDISVTNHMPDVLEMPYRPGIAGGYPPGRRPHTYRLAGVSCLAGDVVGDYSFAEPLQIGTRLAFLDMAHYSMVKTTNFNGVCLPDIAVWRPATATMEIIRSFGYEDYKNRLS